MKLIDTHTHLESFTHKGVLPEVLARARDAGVETLITIGTAGDDWSLYRKLAQTHPGFVRYTAGLHPCSVGEDWAAEVAQLAGFWPAAPVSGLAADEKLLLPVALGECGLDRFHLPKNDPAAAERIFAWQRAAFAAQLEIAKRLDCPLVVHSRGAFPDCVAMIDASGVAWPKVVFHCFTEGPAEMSALLERGGCGSFTGVLTYKSAENVREAARLQGLDRFMLETDAPYLTPVPHRGKPNEPAFLRHTAEFAAELFGVGYEELAGISSRTARTFFGLS